MTAPNGAAFSGPQGHIYSTADARGMGAGRQAALKTRSSLPAVHAGFERDSRLTRRNSGSSDHFSFDFIDIAAGSVPKFSISALQSEQKGRRDEGSRERNCENCRRGEREKEKKMEFFNLAVPGSAHRPLHSVSQSVLRL